jgi:uncharacterized alpha/beta hydrolase family protein
VVHLFGLKEEKILVGADVSWVAHSRQVVSEQVSCLYISGKRNKEGKKHSDTHIKWYQSEKISMFFVAEKKREFHHVAEERKTIT